MREAFPPCLPISNSSGIENNNNNHKEFNYNHTTHTASNNHCHKEKDLNIDRNNETTKDIPINETEKICFDSDEGKLTLTTDVFFEGCRDNILFGKKSLRENIRFL